MFIDIYRGFPRFILFILTLFISLSYQTFCQVSDSARPPIQRISEDKYQIGNLILNIEDSSITIPGKINMQKGLIELLACGPGGKLHESVIVLDVIPYHLHVALLLLGLNSGGGLEYQGDPRAPQGDSVVVLVQWKNGDKDTVVRGEDFVWDVTGKKTMQHTPWVFSGSKIINGQYMADIEKSLITTYHDPLTIIDNPLKSGSNDELYVVNESLVPPKETPVMLIIKKYDQNNDEQF